MAAVLQDLININIGDVLGTVPHAGHGGFGLLISRGVIPQGQVFLHPVRIKGRGNHVGYSPAHIRLGFEHVFPVHAVTKGGCQHSDNEHADHDQEQELGPQGQLPDLEIPGGGPLLLGKGILLPETQAEPLLQGVRNETKQQGDDDDHQELVHDVNQDIAQQLRPEDAPQAVVKEEVGKVRAQLLAEIQLIQGKGQDGTQTAADQRQQRHGTEGFAEGPVPVPLGQEGGQGGDQHTDHAVIDGVDILVYDPQQDIGQETGQHAGQVAAEHGGEHCAHRIQVQRDTRQGGQPAQCHIERNAGSTQDKAREERSSLCGRSSICHS